MASRGGELWYSVNPNPNPNSVSVASRGSSYVPEPAWQCGSGSICASAAQVEKSTEDLESILKAKVSDYEQIQEASTAKKAARKLLRQIEESEERAEAVEARSHRCHFDTQPARSVIRSPTHPPTHPRIYPPAHSPTYPSTHLPACPLELKCSAQRVTGKDGQSARNHHPKVRPLRAMADAGARHADPRGHAAAGGHARGDVGIGCEDQAQRVAGIDVRFDRQVRMGSAGVAGLDVSSREEQRTVGSLWASHHSHRGSSLR